MKNLILIFVSITLVNVMGFAQKRFYYNNPSTGLNEGKIPNNQYKLKLDDSFQNFTLGGQSADRNEFTDLKIYEIRKFAEGLNEKTDTPLSKDGMLILEPLSNHIMPIMIPDMEIYMMPAR